MESKILDNSGDQGRRGRVQDLKVQKFAIVGHCCWFGIEFDLKNPEALIIAKRWKLRKKEKALQRVKGSNKFFMKRRINILVTIIVLSR